MKKRLFYLLSCWFALATEPSATAAPHATAPPPQPFVLESTAARPPAIRWLVPDAIEEFRIQVDPEVVAANPEILAIDLPDGSRLEAVRTRFVIYRPDWKSWSGTLRYVGTGVPGTGYVNFGLHGDQLTAMIHYGGERFRIVGGPSTEKGHRLMRLSEDLSPPSCGIETPELSPDALPFEGKKAPASETPLFDAVIGPSSARIDILVVYPRAFFNETAATETFITTFAQQSIQHANDIFANSQIDAWYNLVGIVPLVGAAQPGDAPGLRGLHSSLTWMTTSGPSSTTATEVANLRNAFGADVVTMYLPWAWNAGGDHCGVANFPLANGTYKNSLGQNTNAPFNQRAFTTNRLQCGLDDFTLGHEIGHNYGMSHNGITNTTGFIDPYALGYIFPPAAPTNATVMGCVCTGCFCNGTCQLGQGAVCNRIPYFSDPNRTVDSQTIGTAWNYATALGRKQVVTYAQFRAQSTNAPPDAHFTKSCTNLTCTFDASISTDDTTIPETGYWWDFGDGATGTGRMISHTYNPQVAARVHLVVTDSGGQTDVEWQAGLGPPPVILIATATGSNQISLTWTASTGATSYEVRRKSDGGSYQTVAAPSGNSYTDTVSSNKTYVYSVRALNASGASGWSAPDLATTFFFTDDPVTAGGIIKAVHLTQLRQAINLVRAAADLGGSSFTDLAPTVIKAVHISELRSALDEARNKLGFQALIYTDSTLEPPTVVRAAHIQELRVGVK